MNFWALLWLRNCYANHLKRCAKQLIQARKKAKYLVVLNSSFKQQRKQNISFLDYYTNKDLPSTPSRSFDPVCDIDTSWPQWGTFPMKPLWSCFLEISWPHRRLWCSCITDLPATHTIINIVTLRYWMTRIISDKIIQPLHACTT